MRRVVLAVLAGVLLLVGAGAVAHRIDEVLQATLLAVEADRIRGAMRLVPGERVSSAMIARIDSDGDGAFSAQEQRAYAQRVMQDLSIAIDGVAVPPTLVSWSFPPPAQMRAGLGEIRIGYTIALARGPGDRSLVLANHHLEGESVYLANVLATQAPDVRILAQRRNAQQSLYQLDFRQGASTAMAAHASPGDARRWWEGLQLSSLFHLGMRHIAEGADHLLFLLVLLLAAPLRASGARWGMPVGARRCFLQVLGIVTAFTVGHSITLGLAAAGGVAVPGRPVEVLVALSILVSAAHALRPVFPGREAVVAGLFGLVHGLAFAATLDRLGVGGWERVAGTLAFNAGIEAMQLLVVAAVLPSLLLIGRTRAYRALRICGAALAGAASLGWIVERLFDVPMPVDATVDALAKHGVLVAAVLLATGFAMWRRPWNSAAPSRRRFRPEADTRDDWNFVASARPTRQRGFGAN